MELRHIRYFMAVAEELNFTRAAEKLCIAQPPLSRQIRELEAELGVTLFIRQPHAVHLSEEGQLFRQYASQVLELVGKSVEDVRQMKGGLRGTVYLATVEGKAPELFSSWIAGFQKKYPHVCYNLWNGNSDDVISRLRRGLCELAIITEPNNAEGVSSLSVYQEPWIALLPADNPLARRPGNTVDLAELADYDLIIPSRESRLMEINQWFATVGKIPRVRCRIAHMLNGVELTAKGVGITVYPASANFGFDAPVCYKEIVNPPRTARYTLIWNCSGGMSKAAENFLEYVKAEVTGQSHRFSEDAGAL